MTVIRGANDPLERCGQGCGCGKYIDEVGYCKECEDMILHALENAFLRKYGFTLGLIMKNLEAQHGENAAGGSGQTTERNVDGQAEGEVS